MSGHAGQHSFSPIASSFVAGRHREGDGHGDTWRLLASSFRERRRELAGLAAWVAVEGLPAYLSGRLVALATDQGFLARDPPRGFLWLGVLAAAVALGAWASRQI